MCVYTNLALVGTVLTVEFYASRGALVLKIKRAYFYDNVRVVSNEINDLRWPFRRA